MKKMLRQFPAFVFEWTVNALVLIFGISTIVRGVDIR